MTQNTSVLLAKRPVGNPKPSDFSLRRENLPTLSEGQALLKNHFISLDAGFRNWLDESAGDDVLPAMALGEPVMGLVMGEVIETRHAGYQVGDWLMARIAWQEYSVADDSQFIVKIDPDEPYPMNYYLGVLGDTGLSAYFGMLDIGKPKTGETVLVSAAAGAVGSIAGQIAQIHGARAVGIVGSDEKAERVVAELGYAGAVNHRGDVSAQLAALCPNGVDVYFDNVGGPILEVVLDHLAVGARIALCGAVATYGNPGSGPGNLFQLVTKEALMRGFFAHTQVDRYPEARSQLAQWIDTDKLNAPEYMLSGIESVGPAFSDLFAGRNFGKTIVKLG
ncbi:MAG: zinc-binding dehydrogenase [Pseudomonadales bacterium]|nr:zinc-binding dehydrogenase [Pseudomonadales bacterium]